MIFINREIIVIQLFIKKKQKIYNYHIFFEIAGLSRQTSNY